MLSADSFHLHLPVQPRPALHPAGFFILEPQLRYLLAAFLLLATVAFAAAGIIFSTDPVTVDINGAPLPPGTIKYQFLQSVNGATYAQVGEGPTPVMQRALPTGNVCIVARAVFKPADGRPEGTGPASDPSCLDVAAAVVIPGKPLNPKLVKP